MVQHLRRKQIAVLGSGEDGSAACELARQAGRLLAAHGLTLISGGGAPATRAAAEAALEAGGLVIGVTTDDQLDTQVPRCTALIPCGMGDARNLVMALAGDACIVIGGRAGTLSEVCLAWLHRRPLLLLTGCGGWSERLMTDPPDERGLSRRIAWSNVEQLEAALAELGFINFGRTKVEP